MGSRNSPDNGPAVSEFWKFLERGEFPPLMELVEEYPEERLALATAYVEAAHLLKDGALETPTFNGVPPPPLPHLPDRLLREDARGQ